MKPEARIQAVIEILQNMHDAWGDGANTPADKIVGDYTKKRRYMGSKDRAYVHDFVYKILRFGGALQWWTERAEKDPNPRHLVLLALVMLERKGLHDVQGLYNGGQYAPEPLSSAEVVFVTEHLDKQIDASFMPEWARYNCPEWMEERIQTIFQERFKEEMHALNQEATVDLRVNSLKCDDRSELLFALDKEGIFAAPCEYSPLGIRLQKRAPIFNSDAFQAGLFEVQDEGSQIVSSLVDAKPGEQVIDFCAGAGGKSLAVAAHMRNKGRILAWDVSEARLKQLPKRATRAGVKIIETTPISSHNEPLVERYRSKADWVLLDVPCTGSGTWRRNPDLKWRTSPADFHKYQTLQAEILEAASPLVVSGGAIVYITCSLFAEENEQQIDRFIAAHPDFEVEPVPQVWHKLPVCMGGQDMRYIRMSPATHHTDGFFAAILRKVG